MDVLYLSFLLTLITKVLGAPLLQTHPTTTIQNLTPADATMADEDKEGASLAEEIFWLLSKLRREGKEVRRMKVWRKEEGRWQEAALDGGTAGSLISKGWYAPPSQGGLISKGW